MVPPPQREEYAVRWASEGQRGARIQPCRKNPLFGGHINAVSPGLSWFVGTELKCIMFALRPFDWESLVFWKTSCVIMAGCQFTFQCLFEFWKELTWESQMKF